MNRQETDKGKEACLSHDQEGGRQPWEGSEVHGGVGSTEGWWEGGREGWVEGWREADRTAGVRGTWTESFPERSGSGPQCQGSLEGEHFTHSKSTN